MVGMLVVHRLVQLDSRTCRAGVDASSMERGLLWVATRELGFLVIGERGGCRQVGEVRAGERRWRRDAWVLSRGMPGGPLGPG